MAVTDAPDTLVKAADAKALMLAAEMRQWDAMCALLGINDRLDLRASFGFVLRPDGTVEPVSAGTDEDLDILLPYAQEQARRINARADGAIVVGIRKDGSIDTATWGRTARDCDQIAEVGQELSRQLPACPFQTWFGWGNGGVPKALAPADVATLSPAAAAFVARHTHPQACAA